MTRPAKCKPYVTRRIKEQHDQVLKHSARIKEERRYDYYKDLEDVRSYLNKRGITNAS